MCSDQKSEAITESAGETGHNGLTPAHVDAGLQEDEMIMVVPQWRAVNVPRIRAEWTEDELILGPDAKLEFARIDGMGSLYIHQFGHNLPDWHTDQPLAVSRRRVTLALLAKMEAATIVLKKVIEAEALE